MKTLLVRHARVLVTMDEDRREIEDGAVFVRGPAIEAVGRSADLPQQADEVIDATDQLVMPGLVNTHHHMYQTLTRALRPAQDNELFGWLQTLYPVWARLTPEMLQVSTQIAMAELLLSGCTTSSDHLYLFPNGCTLDDTLHAAAADRHALPRRARRHERGPEPGRPAARQRGRGRSRRSCATRSA